MSGGLNSRTSCFKLRCLQNVQRCSKRSLHFKCAGHWSGPFPFKTHNLLRAFQRSADVHGFSKIQTVLEYHIVQEIVILSKIYLPEDQAILQKGNLCFAGLLGINDLIAKYEDRE